MCGIAFSLRSSFSYTASGTPLSGDKSDASPGDPELGIPLSSGERAPQEIMLSANGIWTEVVEAVSPRGPDWHCDKVVNVQARKGFKFEMRYHASVLHLRGAEIGKQPFVDPDSGDVFLFNGEIWDGLEVMPYENDGLKLFQKILLHGPGNLFSVMRDIEGPYAFIYFHAAKQRLWFGRDPLGRRSLLMHKPTSVNPFLLLASCGTRAEYPLHEWEEVTSDALHCYNLLDLNGKSWLEDGKRGMCSFARHPRSLGLTQDILIYPFDKMNRIIPTPDQLIPLQDPHTVIITPELQQAMVLFKGVLEESVRKRTADVPRLLGPAYPTPRIAILFSGGIDCTTLALLVDRFIPMEEGIDLLNVAFENPRTLANAQKERERKEKAKAPKMIDLEELINGILPSISPSPASLDFDSLSTPPQISSCVNNSNGEENSNVPSSVPSPPAEDIEPSPYDVPDRLNARASLEELQAIAPRRKWTLVEVDVPYSESTSHKERVRELMCPSQTVMDLSIAMALYFAARGRGSVYSPTTNTSTPYTSGARVLLSGLGADELLGGYSRHRRAFTPSDVSHLEVGGDWASLIQEMQLDLDRISIRNLGRDDRVVSTHGKEVRYPFLDGNVVSFLNNLPIWLKTDLRFEESLGDKLLLRSLASALGLQDCCRARKRAIQFGSRSARMEKEEQGKTKGQDTLNVDS